MLVGKGEMWKRGKRVGEGGVRVGKGWEREGWSVMDGRGEEGKSEEESESGGRLIEKGIYGGWLIVEREEGVNGSEGGGGGRRRRKD